MMKYRNLIVTIILIIVWSLFFASYKYFVWGIFKNDTITLQYISAYISIGTIPAFIIGGLIYELFREKKYHAGISAILVFFLLLMFVLSKLNFLKPEILVAFFTVLVGLFYGLWAVLRNILISSQIEETGLSDTKVNGLANIAFISFIIIGSIFGGFIAEKTGIYGSFVIIGMIMIGFYVGLWLRFKNIYQKLSIKQKAIQYKNTYITDFKFIIKKYLLIMIFVSAILAIATILSQKAIEYNVKVLGKTPSSAAIILLYSAVGSIIGNIISMKIVNNKWTKFMLFSIFFAISAFLFPILISNFIYTLVLATVAGFFFGVVYNLLESYFLKQIAIDNKKSYGSVSFGIISSIVIAVFMFLVDFIQSFIDSVKGSIENLGFFADYVRYLSGFSFVYYFLSLIIVIVGAIVFNMRNKLK